MIVSDGEKTYVRFGQIADAKVNGSFLDIHFVYMGENHFIALNLGDLQDALEILGNAKIHVEFDEPANVRTLTLEFIARTQRMLNKNRD